MTNTAHNPTIASRLPVWLATALVCAVFPLIWVGGLVTTSDAGMSVPDWPTTYGYNMFLYPWHRSETWGIFVEHGHRLLASVVGLITIVVAVAARRAMVPSWLRQMSYWCVALVIFQGVLGGLRVVLAKETLALVHGCVGPLFFVYCVALRHFLAATITDRSLAISPTTVSHATTTDDAGRLAGVNRLYRLAVVTTALAYLQLVLGAVVRHTPHMAGQVTPSFFRFAVLLHLFMAGVLTVHVVLLAVRSYRAWSRFGSVGVIGPAGGLIGFIVVQLLLGVSTWIVNYGFPEFAARWSLGHAAALEAQSFIQVLITTAHVAIGSLIIALSATLAIHARAATLRSRSVVPARSSAAFACLTSLVLGPALTHGGAV